MPVALQTQHMMLLFYTMVYDVCPFSQETAPMWPAGCHAARRLWWEGRGLLWDACQQRIAGSCRVHLVNLTGCSRGSRCGPSAASPPAATRTPHTCLHPALSSCHGGRGLPVGHSHSTQGGPTGMQSVQNPRCSCGVLAQTDPRSRPCVPACCDPSFGNARQFAFIRKLHSSSHQLFLRFYVS